MATIHVTDLAQGASRTSSKCWNRLAAWSSASAPRTLRIVSGWAVREEAAPYELDGYLTVFKATHPGVRAERPG